MSMLLFMHFDFWFLLGMRLHSAFEKLWYVGCVRAGDGLYHWCHHAPIYTVSLPVSHVSPLSHNLAAASLPTRRVNIITVSLPVGAAVARTPMLGCSSESGVESLPPQLPHPLLSPVRARRFSPPTAGKTPVALRLPSLIQTMSGISWSFYIRRRGDF